MKQLKFRAWHLTKKEMYFGTAGKDGGLVFVAPKDIYADDRAEIGYRSKEIVIMQFIGAQDARGREIYEGDIVVDGNGREFTVVYDQTRATFLPFQEILPDTVTISGNIYTK